MVLMGVSASLSHVVLGCCAVLWVRRHQRDCACAQAAALGEEEKFDLSRRV